MKPRDFKYFFQQAAAGVMSNWLMSLASVCIVIASLAVFGIFIVLGINLGYISDQIEKQCQINVYVPRDTTEAEFKAVGKELEKIKNVEKVTYYTKEERYENYKEGYYSKDSEAIKVFEDDNPLRDSCILTLSDASKAKGVIKAAAKVKGVEEVKDSLELINKIVSITNTIRTVTAWLLIVLIVIAVFIISNTIKIGMFARRKEINIMKFVGATNWFIRWPFIFEGMILGFCGSLIAATLVMIAYEGAYADLASFFGSVKLADISAVYNYIVWGFIGLGTLIGMIGSYTSIRKYLHV